MSKPTENKALTGSGLEKKGGYPSGEKAPSPGAKVPSGPAPGAQHKPASGQGDKK